ncbi:hypothetical protein HZS_7348 [Henneguya salminicola]|nr:hypothetical protein HZS_7348 [Henneguya salminicola]
MLSFTGERKLLLYDIKNFNIKTVNFKNLLNQLNVDLATIQYDLNRPFYMNMRKSTLFDSGINDLVSLSGNTTPEIINIKTDKKTIIQPQNNHLLPISASYIFSDIPMIITVGIDGLMLSWTPIYKNN